MLRVAARRIASHVALARGVGAMVDIIIFYGCIGMVCGLLVNLIAG